MSESLTAVPLMALTAFLISSADSGAEEEASSSAMSVTSSSVSWLPSKANNGM